MGDRIATRDAYGNALVKLGETNPSIVVLDADLSKSTKTAGFAKKFPERFIQMGIAEADMMATAAGLATCGKIPFASTFAIFATGRAYDQVRNTVGYPHLNVKIAATHAGITVGEDGGSHQSIEDIALMRVIPGMTVLNPADAVEAEKLILAAAEYQGPVYIRLGREPLSKVFTDDYQPEIGKAVRLRDGKAATIIATGIMVEKALQAADILGQKGTTVRVVNIHTIKPIDAAEIIKAAWETRAIVTAEEHSIIGGLGSAVSEVVVQNHPVPIEYVGVKDRFGQSGIPAKLLEEYELSPEHIVAAVEKAIGRKNP
ncbi:transketolase [Hydrogenispora ethanolica]|jgi:transketolase|uniref:Transketolase n=1 Tax=Hydrogenispora ethanolica TaxID=1082276 RepID=A0A4R1QUE8_HYDET|nr:transketolase family protein [Hydrogenispora ethanolica]TCL57127.1 transketolase [Hydrogenispora ethanolica]